MKNWISKYLTDDEIQKISRRVTETERHTSGEIVPVIVRRSSVTGHLSLVLTLCLSLVFFLIEFPFSHHFENELWFTLNPLMVLVFWGLSRRLAPVDFLQRLFIPLGDQQRQVWQRAELEFSRNKVARTAGGTGILIFVSVMERKALVLADEGISKQYSSDTWTKLVNDFSEQLKKGHWALGFEQAIGEAGKILAEKLPAERHNTNELANSLRILE